MVLVVPAIIGLSVVGAVIYLAIDDPSQEIPEILTGSMTTILGYYFGYAAGS